MFIAGSSLPGQLKIGVIIGNMKRQDVGRDMTKIKSTYCPEVIFSGFRMSGNSTRQVDYAIQMLFQGYIVRVEDHYMSGASNKVNNYLFDRVGDRLKAEHERLFTNKVIRVDRAKFEFEIMDKQYCHKLPARRYLPIPVLELTWFERTVIKLFLKKLQKLIEGWT
jgi:hypothetical protein